MSKIATMSIAEDFTIKGTRKLHEEGFISDETRKAIKVAIFSRAKMRNNIDPDTKIGYEGNSDEDGYLNIYDKETKEPLNEGESAAVGTARELADTKHELNTLREKVAGVKDMLTSLGL